MKKIYLSILSVALVSGLSAQVKNQNGPVKRSRDITEAKSNDAVNQEKMVTIWSNTFGTPSDWVIAHDATACSLDWQLGVNSCSGSFAIADIASTTAADGYGLLDSDAYGGPSGGTEVEDSWLTMANPVDLTGYPNVVVQFESHYRAYNAEQPYIVVGIGDGLGNVTWPDLTPTTDISAMTNVFPVYANYAVGTSSDNPELTQVNISPALVGLSAAQQTDIYIRFHWTGTWGYAWFVDDIAIIEQPADDIQILSAWIAGENNGNVEYGKNPINQLDANWVIGAQVYNFGINDQTNVIMTADFTTFNSMGTDALLEADSTVLIENLETPPAFTAGVYTGTYTAVSDNEVGGAFFGNNTETRVFEVTGGSQVIYSIDGIDVYPAADLDLTSMGTGSFTGGEDGLVIASMYHIKTATQVSGIRSMLVTTGSNPTVVGGEIYGSIKDTTTFWQDDMSSLFNTAGGTVTAADIANGYIDVMFPTGPITLNPGVYYAAVELYSNGNANDIRIYDDRTVAEPYYGSAIYIPGDQSYSNGTASGVRLLMGSDWGAGIDENALEGVSIYPNPSEGIINVTNVNGTSNTIEVHNMLGQEILTKVASASTTVDLSANGTGVYLVKVSNENGSIVERVVIK